MNDRQLRAFLIVAETKSYSKAEIQLYLTRQAIQKQITSLEAELGESLFYSSRSGTTLTPFGQYFFPLAKKMLTEHDNIIKACAVYANKKLSVRIGSTLERTPQIFDTILKNFRQEYPDAAISMQYASFDDKLEMLELDTLNLIIDYAEPLWQRPEFELFPLCQVPYVCFVNENSDLAGKDEIKLEDLKDRQIGLWAQGHKFMENLLLESNQNIAINRVERNNIIEIISTCYNDGVYISKSDSFQDDVSLKRIPFDKRYMLTIALIHKTPPSASVKQFLNISLQSQMTDKR